MGRIWNAVVDTGFNGYVELPDALQVAVESQYICRIRSLLAGGQAIEEDNNLVDFSFEGVDMKVEATFAPVRDMLLGTRLLRSHVLQIDFVARTVQLERQETA